MVCLDRTDMECRALQASRQILSNYGGQLVGKGPNTHNLPSFSDFLRWLGVEDVVRWTSHVEAGTTTRRVCEPAPFVVERKVRYFRCSLLNKEAESASSRVHTEGRWMGV